MTVIKGSDVAKALNAQTAEEIASWNGIVPKAAIIRVGDNPDDISYERGAVKRLESVGIACQLVTLPGDITQQAFLEAFSKVNDDPSVHGILLLRPLPPQLDETPVRNQINPDKDIDGISPINLAKVFSCDDSGFAPCTAKAVMEILDYAGVNLHGKNVAVVGASLVVGRPLSMLMLAREATVTLCHIYTKDVPKECREADIVVVACGVPKLIGEHHISEGTVVIDVGINLDENGKLCGDVDFDAVAPKASLITPVPGGVGAVTTSSLASQVVKAARRLTGKENR